MTHGPNSAERDHAKIAREFQQGVLSGSIPACRWIRLACERNDRDTERARRGWVWKFDEDKARRICEFVELLPHIKGRWQTREIKLEPWQSFILACIFGWVDHDGYRRFRNALIVIPRKNGKTLIAAAVALYLLALDKEPGAEVYSAATTRDQAKISWELAKKMVERTPGFRDRYGIAPLAHSIAIESDAAWFKPLSRDSDSLEGLNPHGVVIDELHAHKTREVFDVMDEAEGARSQPLKFIISTEGDNPVGVFADQVSYLQQILLGNHEDDTYFGALWTVDTQPFDAPIQSSLDLLRLDALCSCENVRSILRDQLLPRVYAQLATTGSGEKTTHTSARNIQIGQSGPGACVHRATNSSSSIEIPRENGDQSRIELSGQKGTAIGEKPLSVNGDLNRKIRHRYSTTAVLSSTDARSTNTTKCSGSSPAYADAAGLEAGFYALIMTTLQEKYGDSCVGGAIPPLDFSGMTREACGEHSNTCWVRKVRFENGRLIAQFPPDEWTEETAWAKANPNLYVRDGRGQPALLRSLQARVNRARRDPASQASFKTKRLNIRVGAADAYFNLLAWQQLCYVHGLRIKDFIGARCIMTQDLASKSDLAARMTVFRGDGTRGKAGEYYVFGRYYLPSDALQEGSPNYDFYRGWKEEGRLTFTDGPRTDYAFIEEHLKADAAIYHPECVGIDPNYNGEQFRQNMDAAGLPVIEIPHNVARFSEPMKDLASLILAGKVHHDGDPVLAWAVGNVVAKEDAKGNVYPKKSRPENKIDPAVMLIANMSEWLHLVDETSVYSNPQTAVM